MRAHKAALFTHMAHSTQLVAKNAMALSYLFVAALAFLPGTFGVLVNISNIDYRRNTTGHIMDAHDGSYNRWTPDGPWYYYAMGYGTCLQGGDKCHGCGYGYSWIGVWKSDTMANGTWTLVREARDDSWPKAIYFRVHVIYNRNTRLYVMWANLNRGKADYAVGASADPEGPFKFVCYANAAVRGGGDFDIFIDDDSAATAYLIFTGTTTGHTMSVERLDPTYTRSLAVPTLMVWKAQITGNAHGPTRSNVSSGIIGMAFVEAPAMFKRRGVIYALFGNCCCFCGQGSGIQIYTAMHPLGPWTYHNNIGCTKPTSSHCGCGMNHDGCEVNYGSAVTRAQQNFVMPVMSSTGATEYIWTGDRWQSGGCPDPSKEGTPECDPDKGIKYMDLQYWSPLKFVKDPNSGIELPQQLSWQDWVAIDMG